MGVEEEIRKKVNGEGAEKVWAVRVGLVCKAIVQLLGAAIVRDCGGVGRRG
jgi:hypothetical protein